MHIPVICPVEKIQISACPVLLLHYSNVFFVVVVVVVCAHLYIYLVTNCDEIANGHMFAALSSLHYFFIEFGF